MWIYLVFSCGVAGDTVGAIFHSMQPTPASVMVRARSCRWGQGTLSNGIPSQQHQNVCYPGDAAVHTLPRGLPPASLQGLTPCGRAVTHAGFALQDDGKKVAMPQSQLLHQEPLPLAGPCVKTHEANQDQAGQQGD